MKKILIFFLIFSFFKINSFANEIGKGELILKKNIVDYFIKYIRGKHGKKPGHFLVTKNSNWAIYYYCPESWCSRSPFATKECKDKMIERLGFGEDCFIFAEQRAIVWDNGNNLHLADKVINSEWSDDRIKEKLKELGFFVDVTVNTSPYNNKSQTMENTNSKSNFINELNDLNKLYKSGALTKEEFEKAKKKLLN